MKSTLILTIFTIGVLYEGEEKSELQSIYKFGNEEIIMAGGAPISPYPDIQVLDEKRVLLWDSKGEYPFWKIDVDQNNLKGAGSWGQGPGEVIEEMPKIISTSHEQIFVHEHMVGVTHVYDQQMNYISSLHIEEPYSAVVYLSEDTYLIRNQFIPPDSEELYLFELHYNDRVKNLIRLDTIPKLGPLIENGALRSGPITTDRENNFYIANMYSSVIFKLNSEGELVYMTWEPDHVEPPNAQWREVEGRMVHEPDEATFQNLSLAVDKEHLYMLYSGEHYTLKEIRAEISGIPTEEDLDRDLRVGRSNILRVYDKNSGDYIDEFVLPSFVNSIAVDDSYLYGSVYGINSYLEVFEKPKLR